MQIMQPLSRGADPARVGCYQELPAPKLLTELSVSTRRTVVENEFLKTVQKVVLVPYPHKRDGTEARPMTAATILIGQ